MRSTPAFSLSLAPSSSITPLLDPSSNPTIARYVPTYLDSNGNANGTGRPTPNTPAAYLLRPPHAHAYGYGIGIAADISTLHRDSARRLPLGFADCHLASAPVFIQHWRQRQGAPFLRRDVSIQSVLVSGASAVLAHRTHVCPITRERETRAKRKPQFGPAPLKLASDFGLPTRPRPDAPDPLPARLITSPSHHPPPHPIQFHPSPRPFHGSVADPLPWKIPQIARAVSQIASWVRHDVAMNFTLLRGLRTGGEACSQAAVDDVDDVPPNRRILLAAQGRSLGAYLIARARLPVLVRVLPSSSAGKHTGHLHQLQRVPRSDSDPGDGSWFGLRRVLTRTARFELGLGLGLRLATLGAIAIATTAGADNAVYLGVVMHWHLNARSGGEVQV
ncbi:hypothetical protein EVG20_g3029 [Dentipellis fragilis]|uniref:Uncharacterized protein n=1 Tax=Dentipellis fragilis TaxID=205917 RepID=A0A4Y9Z7D5_9AGAM|nr:hypothetical protein EVG20_g3029 [Dentipellis fragilis]